jgi:sulfonate transport system ATP-binding protein
MTTIPAIAERVTPVAVSCSQVSKRFGPATVLPALDLTIAPGQSVAIVGRSGCGKSTLLRLITGLEAVTGGHIIIDGEALTGLNPKARVMFQDACLMPWKRVRANVALGLRAADHDRSDWALAQVGLADRAHDWPRTLSGGQRQRISLARALASRPGLLLLDEPLGALDALTRLDMQRLIESLWTQQGFTLILVTHDVDEAVALADRVLVMDQGRWTADFAIDLPRPRNRSSQDFIAHRERVLAAVMTRSVA